MNENKIKTMLSREVLKNIKDYSTNAILRGILFNDNNKIDWDEAYKIILAFMPELKQYSGYYGINMK